MRVDDSTRPTPARRPETVESPIELREVARIVLGARVRERRSRVHRPHGGVQIGVRLAETLDRRRRERGDDLVAGRGQLHHGQPDRRVGTAHETSQLPARKLSLLLAAQRLNIVPGILRSIASRGASLDTVDTAHPVPLDRLGAARVGITEREMSLHRVLHEPRLRLAGGRGLRTVDRRRLAGHHRNLGRIEASGASELGERRLREAIRIGLVGGTRPANRDD